MDERVSKSLFIRRSQAYPHGSGFLYVSSRNIRMFSVYSTVLHSMPTPCVVNGRCLTFSHLPGVMSLLSFRLSCVQLSVTPWTVARQAPLSSNISWNLLKFMSISSVMLSNHLLLPLTIPCHPLLLLHSIFPSIRVFSSESALCIRWPKYWSFSVSPPSEFSGLISLYLVFL